LNEFSAWNTKYLSKIAAEALEAIGTPEAREAVTAWHKRGE
jgi:hypothetical protein